VEKGLERVPGLGVGVSVIEGLTSHHKRDEPAEPSGGNENGDHTKGHRKVHEKGDKVHEKGHKVHKKVRKGKGKSKQELGQGTQPQSGSPEAHSPGNPSPETDAASAGSGSTTGAVRRDFSEYSTLEARGRKTEFVKAAADFASSVLNGRAPLHDRDLSEISHELLGRDFTELEVELMRRTLPQPPVEGSSSVGAVDPAHSSPSTAAQSVGSHTINEKHLGNCTHHHHPVNGTHPHHLVNGTHPHHLVNGTHPHHYLHCHNGTHEGSTAGVPGQASLKAEPLTPPSSAHPASGAVSGAAKSQPSTAGHRRSFYYELEDLD